MTNMDWECRKALLIRALFAEQPVLSPITEAMEDEEPDSPLPELIIEREPNKHDEPEGFYRQLKLKIKQLFPNYVFRDKGGVQSPSRFLKKSINDKSQSHHQEETQDEIEDDFGADDYDTISMDLVANDSSAKDLRAHNSIDNTKTSDGLTRDHLSPTFTQEDGRTAEVSIHSFDDSLMEHENEEQASKESNAIADDGGESNDTDSDANLTDPSLKNSLELEENMEKSGSESLSAVSCEETLQSSLQSRDGADIMRKPQDIQTSNSPAFDPRPIGSADDNQPNLNVSIDGLIEASIGSSTGSEDLVLAGSFYERDIDDSDPLFFDDLIRSSTPNTDDRLSKVDKSVNVFLDDIDWNDLKKQLFMGDCKVYNLCRCRSHMCED